MTAHELARQLLAGADYEVVVKSQEVSDRQARPVIGAVRNLNMLSDNAPGITQPCIAIIAYTGGEPAEVFPYTRSQTG